MVEAVGLLMLLGGLAGVVYGYTQGEVAVRISKKAGMAFLGIVFIGAVLGIEVLGGGITAIDVMSSIAGGMFGLAIWFVVGKYVGRFLGGKMRK